MLKEFYGNDFMFKLRTLSNTTHVILHYFTTGTEYSWKKSDTGLVYDSVHIENQLYWVDKSDKVKVITTFDDDDRFLQFIKINGKEVSNVPLETSGKILAAIDRNIGNLIQLRRKHQCSTDSPNKKACSHICLPGNVKFLGECWCPTNLTLNTDKQTCIEQEQVIVSQHENFGVGEPKDDALDGTENLINEAQNEDKITTTTLPTLKPKENDSKSFEQYKSHGARNSLLNLILTAIVATNMIIFIVQ